MTQVIRVAVIAGSRRPQRRARAVAEWVCAASVPTGLQLELVDLDDVDLPPLAEPTPAAFGEYALPHTREWSALIDGFDAYVLVTPEYNHSTTAALKDALDHLYHEWRDKPVAFVGYGVEGGIRAVEHLRGIVAELGMAGVGPSVALNLFEDFDDTGAVTARDRQDEMLRRTLVTLQRWARALSIARDDRDDAGATAPAAESSDGSNGPDRPELAVRSATARADDVTARFVADIQGGLDRGDADGYDRSFAADVLWGSPYGAVLRGFRPLNDAHRSMMTEPRPGHSRYEVVHTAAVSDSVVVAHVRRRSLQPAAIGAADFSEMALYVLVERDGQWWLAAGQNTPIATK